MLSRRHFQTGLLGASALALSSGIPVRGQTAQEPELSDDGLHVQDWFLESFLDLAEDWEEARAEQKHLAILWEQRGCPYCREMHRVNLAREDVRGYIEDNFTVLQLNLWGSREVTDFDGEALEERHMARKWAVNFTPTIMLLPLTPEPEGEPANKFEVARMPGYFKPFHFLSMFTFVREQSYKEMGFQRYLQNKFAELKAKGIDPDVW